MNETISYVTRNLRHLLAAPNLTETQRTIITRTLATLSELGTAYSEAQADEAQSAAEGLRYVISSMQNPTGIWRVIDGELTLNEYWQEINGGGR